ncbi:hypothetical protein [Nonomuraea dietziae]|uniref:hypothetical protein n=1 Tax=Nonomuraea dietziae TaxID=65515 RepID=UPI0033F290A0
MTGVCPTHFRRLILFALATGAGLRELLRASRGRFAHRSGSRGQPRSTGEIRFDTKPTLATSY